MQSRQLEPEERRAFDEDGFLVLRNALDADSVASLVEAGDRLAGGFLDKPPVAHRTNYNHLDLRPGLLREKPFVSLVAQAPAVPLIVQLLSPNIHLHSTAMIYKRWTGPDATPFRIGWHRDIRIPRDLGHDGLPRVGIKVCYCLTDFPEPNSGMTLFARGSHKKTTPLALRKGEVDPDDVEVVDMQLKAGDAFIFENRIFHSAAPNWSTRTSKVVMYGYAYRWMKPEVYLENPDDRRLQRLDPITRQLLGGYRDIDTPPWALQDWAAREGVMPAIVPWTVDV
jgi:ectoine hydroxylase-related dioxygenase (phytanoyl-CoA dioxygenase family)